MNSNKNNLIKILIFTLPLWIFSTGCNLGGTNPSNQSTGINPMASHFTQSGEWETSGGDSVKCGSETHVLDYWEYYLNPNPTSLKNFGGTSDMVSFDQSQNIRIFLKTRYNDSTSFQLNEDFKNLNAEEIINKVLEDLWKTAPLFADQVYKAYKNSDLSTWNIKNNIQDIDDSRPIRSLPANCELVQLVSRQTTEQKNMVPLVLYYFNKKIYDSLSEVEKSVIVMHEIVYLIAKIDRHENSDDIRKFVSFLFSTDFQMYAKEELSLDLFPLEMHSTLNDAKHSLFLTFRQILAYPFGDYMKFFIDEPSFALDANVYFQATISMMLKLREQKSLCIENGKTPNACNREIHESKTVQELLDPNEAFVYISRFIYDFEKSNLSYSSEYLSSINSPNKVNAHFDSQKYIGELCAYIKDNNLINHLILKNKAIDVCNAEGFDISKIEDLPFWQSYNCFSEDNTMRLLHKEPLKPEDQSMLMIIGDVDNSTGAYLFPDFQGPFQIQNIVEKEVFRDFGFGNREYEANLDVMLNIEEVMSVEQIDMIKYFLNHLPNNASLSNRGQTINSTEALSRVEEKQTFEIKIHLSDCLISEGHVSEVAFYYH